MTALAQRRWLLVAAAVGIGVVAVIVGARHAFRPRSSFDEGVAWWVLAVGVSLISAGVSLSFVRPITVILVGIASPLIGFCLLLVLAYWPGTVWPSDEQMVRSGYPIIPEAKQIDDLLGPAWHEITNYQKPEIAEWQTSVLFGGRYELRMTVGIRIDRRSGVTGVIGEPRFYLWEIEAIHGRGATFRQAGEHEFGVDQWRRVVKANGDFSVIGIQLDRDNPVPGIDHYQGLAPNGIQMRANDNEAPAPGR